jgi:hypothetical protein
MHEPQTVPALIDSVLADLNSAYREQRFNGAERGRIDYAELQLRDFAKQWHRGWFDKGELEDAIDSIQHVLEGSFQMSEPRDRTDDMRGQLLERLERLQAISTTYDNTESEFEF